jgi:hypothetical protein
MLLRFFPRLYRKSLSSYLMLMASHFVYQMLFFIGIGCAYLKQFSFIVNSLIFYLKFKVIPPSISV